MTHTWSPLPFTPQIPSILPRPLCWGCHCTQGRRLPGRSLPGGTPAIGDLKSRGLFKALPAPRTHCPLNELSLVELLESLPVSRDWGSIHRGPDSPGPKGANFLAGTVISSQLHPCPALGTKAAQALQCDINSVPPFLRGVLLWFLFSLNQLMMLECFLSSIAADEKSIVIQIVFLRSVISLLLSWGIFCL